MTLTSILRLRTIAPALCALFLLVGGCSSDKPTKPPTITPPEITTFTGTPADIVPGDSVLLSYVAVRTDSLKLFPSGQSLSNTGSGSLYVKPTGVTTYTLRAYNRGGQDSAFVSVTMNAAVPSITAMTVSEDTVVVGDSTQVTWTAIRTDSIKLNGGAKLTPATGATVWTVPPVNGQLNLIAYNAYGTDTARVLMRVEVPAAVQHIINRQFFKGAFGSSNQDPLIRLKVVDATANILYKVWIKFSLVEGDGQLSAESLQTAAAGNALLTYNFSGTEGHALIRAMVPGVDTLDLTVRASTIAPGVAFQGQYIKNGDDFALVRLFNGSELANTPDPTYWLNYVDYESQLGFVGIVADTNQDSTAQEFEPIYGVILNTVYADTSQSGWGIGSPIQDLLTEYGVVIPIYDPTPPAAYRYEWPTYGLTAYSTDQATESERTVFEVHVVEAQPTVAAKLPRLQRQR